MDDPGILDGLLPTDELARSLNKSERTIARWKAMPDGLPYIEYGKAHLHDPAAVRQWILGRQRQRNPRRRGRAA